MLALVRTPKHDSPALLALAIRSARIRGRLSLDNISDKSGLSRPTVIRIEKPAGIGRCRLESVLLVIETLAVLGSPVEVGDGG